MCCVCRQAQYMFKKCAGLECNVTGVPRNVLGVACMGSPSFVTPALARRSQGASKGSSRLEKVLHLRFGTKHRWVRECGTHSRAIDHTSLLAKRRAISGSWKLICPR